MIRLILVRHGQTPWNRERRYQGQSDVPLDEIGLRQAQALATHFAKETVHAIYSSDLRRAWDTALPIAQSLGLQPMADARLREASFGVWEGLTYKEISNGWPQELAAWQADPLTHVPPNGEPLQQLLDRVGQCVHDIRRRHADQTVVIVSHGGTLRAVVCHALELPSYCFWRLSLASAAISELRLYDDVALLTLFNDTHVVKHIPANPWAGRG